MFYVIENIGAREVSEHSELSSAIWHAKDHAHDNDVVVVIRETGAQYPVRMIWPDGMVEVG